MKIDRDAFIEWAESKFTSVKVSGDEIQVPDIWWHSDDQDNKCWINTEKCCFRAFKSERTGNVPELVMEVEGCSWHEAVDIVRGEESLYQMEQKLLAFLANQKGKGWGSEPIPATKSMELPESTYLIKSLSDVVPARRWAAEYLKGRKIDAEGLMVCIAGRYSNRIIIPYYDREGRLIYFNSRALSSKSKVRYLGPDKETFGIGKGDVLWMAKWPEPGTKVYLTEGEFDAMSLAQCGFPAAACGGKALSDKQIKMLEPYRICLSFDSDKAGEDSFKIAEKMMENGKATINGEPRFSFVRPPAKYKDWNNLYVHHNSDVMKMYVMAYETPVTSDTLATIGFGGI